MKKEYSFRAEIENPGGGGAFLRIPFDVEKAFSKKRVPVQATIDGEPYRGTLVRMGEPCHILIVLKEIRKKIGKDFGDEVDVILEEDTEQRRVELPEDFRKVLEEDAQAKSAFEKLSYTHQKEYVNAILQAKRLETRISRIDGSLRQLKNKK